MQGKVAHNHAVAPTSLDHRQEVRSVLMVALAVNISMSLLKLIVGVISGSLAVIADAMCASRSFRLTRTVQFGNGHSTWISPHVAMCAARSLRIFNPQNLAH